LEISSIKDYIFGTLKGVQNLQPLSKKQNQEQRNNQKLLHALPTNSRIKSHLSSQNKKREAETQCSPNLKSCHLKNQVPTRHSAQHLPKKSRRDARHTRISSHALDSVRSRSGHGHFKLAPRMHELIPRLDQALSMLMHIGYRPCQPPVTGEACLDNNG
jgi:hypothetical protein